MSQYQPKGQMCAACKYREADCSALNFRAMQRMAQIDDNGNTTIIVRCSQFDSASRRHQLDGLADMAAAEVANG